MSRWLFLPAALLTATVPCFAQTPAPPTTPDASPSAATSSGAAATPDATVASTPAKKVWTNDTLPEAKGNVSVVGDKRNQKYNMTPTTKADAGTVARIKLNLQKLQSQLDDVNKQLAAFKQFQDGEPVSEGGRDVSKGYSRTPVSQQVAKLQTKKKDLQTQIDDLIDEARKKGVDPGQLR